MATETELKTDIMILKEEIKILAYKKKILVAELKNVKKKIERKRLIKQSNQMSFL